MHTRKKEALPFFATIKPYRFAPVRAGHTQKPANGLSPPCRMHAHGSPRCMNHVAFGIPPGHAKTACLLPGFTRVLHCIEKCVKTVKDVVKNG